MIGKKHGYSFSWRTTLVLTIVWVFLWGDYSLGSVVFGVIIGAFVQIIFPLPVIPELRSVNILGLIHLGFWTLGGLVVASVTVAYQVVAFWRHSRNAIVRVRPCTDSEVLTTMTAELVSLIPGSIVVDFEDGEMLVHVFGVRGPDDIRAAKRNVRRTESMVIRAIGTKEQRREHKARSSAEAVGV
ncbi:Na+/H+ antiporter subunit E [Humidisolicoccus flavus]|uniref:Na+/H+ antiporter subunit E n=1 Tax=Humidisolicoccus flavus TaxID=3111414 RepID=UPI003247752E